MSSHHLRKKQQLLQLVSLSNILKHAVEVQKFFSVLYGWLSEKREIMSQVSTDTQWNCQEDNLSTCIQLPWVYEMFHWAWRWLWFCSAHFIQKCVPKKHSNVKSNRRKFKSRLTDYKLMKLLTQFQWKSGLIQTAAKGRNHKRIQLKHSYESAWLKKSMFLLL